MAKQGDENIDWSGNFWWLWHSWRTTRDGGRKPDTRHGIDQRLGAGVGAVGITYWDRGEAGIVNRPGSPDNYSPWDDYVMVGFLNLDTLEFRANPDADESMQARAHSWAMRTEREARRLSALGYEYPRSTGELERLQKNMKRDGIEYIPVTSFVSNSLILGGKS